MKLKYDKIFIYTRFRRCTILHRFINDVTYTIHVYNNFKYKSPK